MGKNLGVADTKVQHEVKFQKKILKIKLKEKGERRSPRLVTPIAKKRSVETKPVQVEILSSSRSAKVATKKRRRAKTPPPARVTRSVSRKENNRDEETESEPEVIQKKRKISAKGKINQRERQTNERKKRKISLKKVHLNHYFYR